MKPRRNFDEVAAAWDEHPGRSKVLDGIASVMFERTALASGMDVLDFGCGTGLLSLRIADRIGSLTGVDTSPAMLEVFTHKAREFDLANVSGVQVDLDRGGDIPGEYDLIISSMVFHHIENIGDVLRRLHAVLKPSGILCIADLDLDGGLFHEDPTGVFHNGFDRDELRELLEQSGFCDVNVGQATEIMRSEGRGEVQRFTTFLATGRRD